MRNALLTWVLLAALPFPASTLAAALNALELGAAQAQLTAAANRDRFGAQVAADGDTVAIAAPDYQETGSQIRGAAFVSRRGPGGWSPPVKLVRGDPAVTASFASSVALSGDTLAIGSANRNSSVGFGRVDVYARANDNWTHQITLAPANATHWFGGSVALQGDDLLVGDGEANLATVYRRIGGVWTEIQQLAPPTATAFSRFGESVAIDGNLIAIGRPYFPSLVSRKGQVLLYRRANAGAPFGFEHSHIINGGGAFPELGASPSGIAIDGNRVLVGAPNYVHSFDGALLETGAVLSLEHDGSNWVTQLLLPSEFNETGWFGMAIAMDGTRALIGAPSASGASSANNGRVYAFVRGAAQWVETQRVPGSSPEVYSGWSIAIGDGYTVVGAPWFFQPDAGAGIAYVHLLDDAPVADAAITLSPTSVPGCGQWPSVATATWTSDGQYCRAVSQGSPSNSSWTDASCPLAPTACLAPLDFRILPALGSTQVTTGGPSSFTASLDGALAIECVNEAGHAARATAVLTVRYPSNVDECPMPAHTVSNSLSQPPTALPNGTFEMRALVSNPLLQDLHAIARHGAHGSVNARIEGTQLVLTYAPDYAAVGSQTQVSDNIGAAVSNGSHAVRTDHDITLPLAVLADGFE